MLERLLWAAIMACQAMLVTKLVFLHLHNRYKWFFSYLLARLVRELTLATLSVRTSAYGWTYVATEPIMWVFYVLVVVELYTLVLNEYPGIQSLGRWVLAIGLALSALVSALTLAADLSGAPPKYPILLYVTVTARGVITSLAIFLLLITGFLVWYPVPLCRNVVVYCLGYATYFLSLTLLLLIRNVAGHTVTRSVSTTMQGVGLACFVFWTVALSRRGEAVTVVLGHRWRPQDEERLIGELSAINRSLLKAAHK